MPEVSSDTDDLSPAANTAAADVPEASPALARAAATAPTASAPAACDQDMQHGSTAKAGKAPPPRMRAPASADNAAAAVQAPPGAAPSLQRRAAPAEAAERDPLSGLQELRIRARKRATRADTLDAPPTHIQGARTRCATADPAVAAVLAANRFTAARTAHELAHTAPQWLADAVHSTQVYSHAGHSTVLQRPAYTDVQHVNAVKAQQRQHDTNKRQLAAALQRQESAMARSKQAVLDEYISTLKAHRALTPFPAEPVLPFAMPPYLHKFVDSAAVLEDNVAMFECALPNQRTAAEEALEVYADRSRLVPDPVAALQVSFRAISRAAVLPRAMPLAVPHAQVITATCTDMHQHHTPVQLFQALSM